jgi:hypothetical protein
MIVERTFDLLERYRNNPVKKDALATNTMAYG